VGPREGSRTRARPAVERERQDPIGAQQLPDAARTVRDALEPLPVHLRPHERLDRPRRVDGDRRADAPLLQPAPSRPERLADPAPRSGRHRGAGYRPEAMTFLLVALIVIVAPGPDFALTVRNSVARGRGTATAFGVVSGQLVWVLASAAGVAAILVASRPAFETLRLLGAAYLAWLGLSMLLSRGGARRAPRPGSAYRQGLVNNLSNPKMPVFFTSLLPQFGTSFAALALHGLAFAALTLAW